MKFLALFFLVFTASNTALAAPDWLTEELSDRIYEVSYYYAHDSFGVGDDGEDCGLNLNDDIQYLQAKMDLWQTAPDSVLVSFSADNSRWPFPGCVDTIKCYAVIDLSDETPWGKKLVWGSCRENF